MSWHQRDFVILGPELNKLALQPYIDEQNSLGRGLSSKIIDQET